MINSLNLINTTGAVAVFLTVGMIAVTEPARYVPAIPSAGALRATPLAPDRVTNSAGGKPEAISRIKRNPKGLLGENPDEFYVVDDYFVSQHLLVDQLQTLLSYTLQPLSDEQAVELFEILAQTMDENATITPDVVTLSRTVLASTQVGMLEQLQELQQLQRGHAMEMRRS